MRGQWKSRKPITYEQAKAVQEAVGCSAPMSRLLAVRGLETREQYDAFTTPSSEDVPDPAELHDAQRACQRIREAKARGEKVLVYGDYDVDGVCAVTLAVRGLREFGIDPAWYVPDRKKDGYGLHQEAARHAAVDGVRLILTVDNGVAAHAAIDQALVRGVDVIVTDHHRLPDILPDAHAIVHPEIGDGAYAKEKPCGTGVVYALMTLLLGREPVEWLPYVALATIADHVPLTGVNRVWARRGIEEMARTTDVGLSALIAQVKRPRIMSCDIAFALAPRINAVGRLGSAGHMVDLFLTDDPALASRLCLLAEGQNTFRQTIQSRVYREALEQIESDPENRSERAGIVAAGPWHEGVIGIVAGQLVREFGKPVLVYSNETGKGSGRSTEEADLMEIVGAIQARHALFDKVGGHAAAVGFTTYPIKHAELVRTFAKVAQEHGCAKEGTEAVTRVDAAVRLEDVTVELAREVESLEPFGEGNPSPVWLLRDCTITVQEAIGKTGEHLRLRLSQGNAHATAVIFRVPPEEQAQLDRGAVCDFLVEIGVHMS